MSHPLFVVGVALWMGSGVCFMAVLFTNGGLSKAHQIGGLLDLLGGHRGAMLLGAVATFTGISASDRARRERCVEHCVAEGYSTA